MQLGSFGGLGEDFIQNPSGRGVISLINPLIWLHYVAVAPVLGAVPPNGLLVVREGETATLECKIKRGNPRPQVTWRRKVRQNGCTTE